MLRIVVVGLLGYVELLFLRRFLWLELFLDSLLYRMKASPFRTLADEALTYLVCLGLAALLFWGIGRFFSPDDNSSSTRRTILILALLSEILIVFVLSVWIKGLAFYIT
jgi:hypothetical protein